MTKPLIPPHGGTLVDRVLHGAERETAQARAGALPALELSERGLADLECIATGVYSPLTGFLGEEDYYSVLNDMRLSSGLAWGIPITLQADEADVEGVESGAEIALTHEGRPLAVMTVTDLYRPDQGDEAEKVYRTRDDAHPGVQAMRAAGPVYLGGPVSLVDDLPEDAFATYGFTPHETRAEFAKRGWDTVVAFQTRNPIHRAHEYLTKTALEIVDGLFINPLVGATRAEDIPADVRMRCYEVLMDNYYPNDRVFLGTYPAAMRYAGPREAILHAVSRQNYGCTHFIVGRDHAGVGDYYGTYDAQEIFERFDEDELAIQPLKFEHTFFCRTCDAMASRKTCPHPADQHVMLSGTRVRAMLAAGESLPGEFSRPEVAAILIDAQRAKAEA